MERRSRRFRHPPVTLEIVDENRQATPLSCFDLSAVGVYLHSSFLLQPGEQMQLRIRVPNRRRPIDVLGEVVRVETGENGLFPGMGIAFRKILEADATALKQFLLRRFLSNA
jgi:hypothetical protein